MWPALKTRRRAPSRTASAASRIDARGLRRSAAAAGSAISMRSGVSSDLDVERGRPRMPRQLALDRARVADEQQPDLQMTRGDQRPVDDAAGPVVAAHRVDGDAHRSATSCQLAGLQLASVRPRTRRDVRASPSNWRLSTSSVTGRLEAGSERSCRLCLVDRPDLAALVVAAVRADLVRRLSLPGTADRCRPARPSARRGCGAWRSGSSNAGVSDWASQFSFCRFSSPLSGASRGIFPPRLRSRTRCRSDSRRTRAQPAAGLAAQRLHRQRELELLAQQLDHVEHAVAVERGREIVLVDLALGIRRRLSACGT